MGEIQSDVLVRHLEEQAAELFELGYFQMFRWLPPEDERMLEGVAGRFWAANGNPLARVRIDQAVYLFSIDELEEALLDPAGPEVRNGPPIVLDNFPSPEACRKIPGAFVMSRFVLEVRDERLLEPLPALILEAGQHSCELQIGEEFPVRPR
jgi:hypothetical protein